MKMKNSNVQIQGIGFALTITGLLKVLWNKLFPELFGFKKITYWQSVMLYLICKALFDFRYNIKDSFNFGNNTINGDSAKKNAPKKEDKAETEVDIEVVDNDVQEAVEEVKENIEEKIIDAEKKAKEVGKKVKETIEEKIENADKK